MIEPVNQEFSTAVKRTPEEFKFETEQRARSEVPFTRANTAAKIQFRD